MSSTELKKFKAPDGTDCFYRNWQGTPEGDIIIYLHGIESHTGWFIDTGNLLNQKGLTVYALERRGSGVNQIDRGFVKSCQVFLDDLRQAIDNCKKENPGKKVYLMGLCWGGKLAATFAALNTNLIDGLILVSPGIKTKVDISPSAKIDVLFSNFIRPRKLFDVPIQDEMFTKNPKYLNFIKTDKLKLKRVTARFFFESARMDAMLGRNKGKIKNPVLLLMAGDDKVVNNAKLHDWFREESVEDKTLKVYQGSCHSLEFEEEAKDMIDDITNWINERKN